MTCTGLSHKWGPWMDQKNEALLQDWRPRKSHKRTSMQRWNDSWPQQQFLQVKNRKWWPWHSYRKPVHLPLKGDHDKVLPYHALWVKVNWYKGCGYGMPVWEFVKIIYMDIKTWTIIKISKLVIIGKRRNMDCIFSKDTKKRGEFKRMIIYKIRVCAAPHKCHRACGCHFYRSAAIRAKVDTGRVDHPSQVAGWLGGWVVLNLLWTIKAKTMSKRDSHVMPLRLRMIMQAQLLTWYRKTYHKISPGSCLICPIIPSSDGLHLILPQYPFTVL